MTSPKTTNITKAIDFISTKKIILFKESFTKSCPFISKSLDFKKISKANC